MLDSANWQLPFVQCMVGGGLGLGEVKRRYCLEVSNPTQNKEDGRNVLCSPINVLKAHTRAHTHTVLIYYIYMDECTCVCPATLTHVHTNTQQEITCRHTHRRSLTPVHTNTYQRTHAHTQTNSLKMTR